MQTLDQALLTLCRNGIISREAALDRSVDAEELKKRLNSSY
jgi:Tfp pilus assembly ATPase PilU